MLTENLKDIKESLVKHEAELEAQLISIVQYAKINNLDKHFMSEYQNTIKMLSSVRGASKCIRVMN